MASRVLGLIRSIGRHKLTDGPPTAEAIKDRQKAIVSWYSAAMGGDPNPDRVVQKAGSFEPYKKMRLDPIVNAAIAYLTYHAIPDKGNVICNDDAIREYCEFSIQKRMTTRFDVIWRNMTHWALVCGFAGGEMVWEPYDDEFYLADIRLKDPDYVAFNCNETGAVKDILFRQNGEGAFAPISRPYNFPVLRFNTGFSNPYGESMLKPAWQLYNGRYAQLKNLLLHGERTAYPTLLGIYPDGADPTAQSLYRTVLQQISRKVIAMIPASLRIQALEAGLINPDLFIKPLEHMTREIFQAICGGYLMLTEGGQSTSYSAGTMHEQTVENRIRAIRSEVEDCINRHVLFHMARYKFGLDRVLKNPPRYEFTPIVNENPLELAQTIKVLTESGVKVPVDWIKVKLNLPEETTMIDILSMQQAAQTNDGRISTNQKLHDDTKNTHKIDRSANAKGQI